MTLTGRVEGELIKAIRAIRNHGNQVDDERIARIFAVALVEGMKSYEARCAGWSMDQADRCRQMPAYDQGPGKWPTAQCSRAFGHDDALECRYKPEEINDEGRRKT